MQYEFIKPVLTGARFNNHSVPLSILKDFTIFEEMVIETAKWKYKQLNADKKRIPRDFSKDMELHLTSVNSGSAILNISITLALLIPPNNLQYFESAKQEILQTIQNVAVGTPPTLPPSLLTYFDKFGRELNEGDSIEFENGSSSRVQYTPEVRKKLVRLSESKEWTENVKCKGVIFVVNKDNKTFGIRFEDGSKVMSSYEQLFSQTIKEAFDAYDENARVLIDGIVVREENTGAIKSFESISHLTLLDKLDVTTRLAEFEVLEDGWLDGKAGYSFDKNALKTLSEYFEYRYTDKFDLPYLYPTPDKTIRAEWSFHDTEISLEIDTETFLAFYHSISFEINDAIELNIDLNNQSGWDELNAQLLALTEKVNV